MSKTHKFPIKNKNDEDITLNEYINDLKKNIIGKTIKDSIDYISNNYPSLENIFKNEFYPWLKKQKNTNKGLTGHIFQWLFGFPPDNLSKPDLEDKELKSGAVKIKKKNGELTFKEYCSCIMLGDENTQKFNTTPFENIRKCTNQLYIGYEYVKLYKKGTMEDFLNLKIKCMFEYDLNNLNNLNNLSIYKEILNDCEKIKEKIENENYTEKGQKYIRFRRKDQGGSKKKCTKRCYGLSTKLLLCLYKQSLF